jgi:di/tricarboxylate transporter
MTLEIVLTLAVLVGTVVLFILDRFSPAVVSLLALLVLAIAGLLTPDEALSSMASPVVVAIASIFVLSAALFQTGVATRVGRVMFRLAGDKEWLLLTILMVSAAVLSGFMNNVAGTAVLMPAVIGIAVTTKRSEACLLLPLALASSYGGLLTLIGSPPNLIASQALVEAGYEPFGFLEVTPIGILSLAVAIVYMIVLGPKLLPHREVTNNGNRARTPGQLIELYRLREYVYFLVVQPASPLVGQSLHDSNLGRDYGLVVLGIFNGAECRMAPTPRDQFEGGSRLLVQADPRRIQKVSEELNLSWERATVDEAELLIGDVGVAEATLTPRSALIGQTLREIDFRGKYGLTVIALWRAGELLMREISDERLHRGDAFLLQGEWPKIQRLQREPGLLLLSEHESVPRRTRKAPWALLSLALMVGTVLTGLLPIQIAALAAAILVVLTGCLRVEEAWEAIEWRAVFLIAGMLALSLAMQKTGAAEWIALTVLGPVARLGPLATTAAFLLITGALTMWISNHASAALTAPIAVHVALSHGMDPRPLLMAVAVGTTVALFTPFAHPSLILVMGPGGYKFGDYVRVGLPLSLILLATSLLGITLLYGL